MYLVGKTLPLQGYSSVLDFGMDTHLVKLLENLRMRFKLIIIKIP